MTKEDIGKKLKAARIACGMTQQEVANKIGRKQPIIGHWETGYSQPDANTLFTLCDIYGTTVDEVFGFSKKEALSKSEFSIIKKYRFVSRRSPGGAKMVDSVLDREYSLAKQISDQQNRIQELETENQEITEKIRLLRIYTYFGRIACAGESFDFSEIPDETIEAPYMEGADFIIGVNGDSMEPDYHDGDRLYVKKTDRMTYGDVGIFTINNECFLKEYGKDGLISRNKDYNNMAGTEDVQLIGKVIGKV